ncbi:transcription initiation factor TFIID subunit 4B [Hemicordylus capensis]|uniref:transcription initiation factor TFIID subunit 4B n=1 Tax=Hemicordylus capensis TaxID=884348 RepID=UPI0023037480|nr:transcription initiation factor TFIID subunit 4B [Hemicordylus capensis]
MSAPPVAATAAAAALGRVMPTGPPEHAALAAGPPVNGAGGLPAAPAVLRAQGTAPPVSCPVTPTGSAVVTLNITGIKAPLKMTPSISQQPRVVSTPVGTLVAKVAPGIPVQQLPKPSSGGAGSAAPHPVAAKAPQTTTIQLPANFQVPQGTVLLRSNTGQLMLVSQQALAQAQSQTQNNPSLRQSIPTNASTVKTQILQNSGTQVFKVLTAPVKTVSKTSNSIASAAKKPAVIQSVASTDSIATVTTVKSLVTGPSSKLSVSASDTVSLSIVQNLVPEKEDTTIVQTSTSMEMLENVKKCKNFLATLIKLASSGPQAPEMGQNVKNLVQSLLEAKIEPEEFTKKLYIELKSSPQPYLVPFLKKSMIALRQLMPNTQNFIQQCLQQSAVQTAPPACITAKTSSVVATSTPVTTASLQTPRTPLGIPSSLISGPTPCTALVTRGSGSLQFVQPAHALSAGTLSLHSPNPIPSTQLTTATTINTVKAVHPTSSMPMVTTSFQVAKPVLVPAVSSEAHSALSSVKSAVSAVATTSSLQAVKPVLTAAAAPTKAVTTSLQSVMPVTGTPITIRVAHPKSILPQSVRTSQGVKVKQLIVQQPSGSILKKVTTPQPSSALPVVNKLAGKTPFSALIRANQLPAGSIVKQITLPGNKIMSLQASPVQRSKIRENGTSSFRDEDDINDVTYMAGVNLSEENACILATNSETVGTLIQSCPEEPLLSSDALQKTTLEIGKRHDITEVNSDVLNLISHATQERLRGLLEKLTIIAQHRMMTYKESDKYIMSSDTRAQLRFLEKLDHMEKQRKDEEEREMLLRAVKSRSNKEDPEQLRLKQKAKEMQQLELAQMQQREANRAALVAIGPRKKRPLDSSSVSAGLEGLNRSPSLAKPFIHPRITRICLRDLIFCMEQEKEMKHSLVLYQALLK